MRNNGLLSRLLQRFERRNRPWFEQGRIGKILGLLGIRERLRSENLHDTGGGLPEDVPLEPPSPETARRTPDGSYTDRDDPTMGMAGRRYLRNVQLAGGYPDQPNVLVPNPREISNKLLKRDEFTPVPTLNVLAAAWIQFQVHDWTSHGKNQKEDPWKLPIPDGDDWPLDDLWILRSTPDTARPEGDEVPPTFSNTVTHWWDASQIYGSEAEQLGRMRTGSWKRASSGRRRSWRRPVPSNRS